MKHKTLIFGALLLAAATVMQSCDLSDDDDNRSLLVPTALVTVCPQSNESVLLQLDDSTQLRPVNITKSPYGSKEVRALVNYSPVAESHASGMQQVKVNWLDSIRTKPATRYAETDAETYGDDPLELVRDWVTVAEDGYLTLRVRTLWGAERKPHTLTLTYGQDPDAPLELTLRHNAHGDVHGQTGDALIAFNLRNVIAGQPQPAKIKIKWKSFSGEKSAEFSLRATRQPQVSASDRALSSHAVQ